MRKSMIDRTHALHESQQCKDLAMSPFTAFYKSYETSLIHLALMRHIDKLYLVYPLATRRILHEVARRGGHRIDR